LKQLERPRVLTTPVRPVTWSETPFSGAYKFPQQNLSLVTSKSKASVSGSLLTSDLSMWPHRVTARVYDVSSRCFYFGESPSPRKGPRCTSTWTRLRQVNKVLSHETETSVRRCPPAANPVYSTHKQTKYYTCFPTPVTVLQHRSVGK
jgi:hypothetical protein